MTVVTTFRGQKFDNQNRFLFSLVCIVKQLKIKIIIKKDIICVQNSLLKEGCT